MFWGGFFAWAFLYIFFSVVLLFPLFDIFFFFGFVISRDTQICMPLGGTKCGRERETNPSKIMQLLFPPPLNKGKEIH